ncbi:unnamed protein product [Vicia faba]|uniref:Zinc finger PHD-type domain-containing protein n=1 Tax=Vicia faba TaxID=3906 RepID=A0AAV0YLH4_VICFA|nr:unnamed protein product [Vicia faba]
MKRRFADLGDEPESEIEYQSLLVSNYHLEDDDDKPVSFSVLPIQWSDSEVSNVDGNRGKIFLHGSSDSGLQKIFMQVTAWKFDLSGLKPEVSLLSKDGRWIKLQKPRKSFQDTVKTVLITLYFLHCVKRKPRLSTDSFWSNLCKDRDLSSYGFKPSHKDLLDHMPLIGEATRRHVVLARSKLLLTVLGDKPEYQKVSYEEFEDLPQPGFTDDDTDNDIVKETDEDSKVEDDLFDSVCAMCDNGGDLIMCDGACMRSFHATKADGRESMCDSLGFTKKQVDDIETFYCKNCEYRQHQCFACGELGSSDKDKGPEVFKCASETCDRFYHPHCVAKLLPPEKHISEGKPFTCPIHFCCVCKGLENKMEHELQFGVCNRCPKSYHRKCLPIGIAFDIDGVETRAWEGLLPNNRILIYCLNHEIIDTLGTPVRDHVKFPKIGASVRENNISNKRMKPTTKERVILENNVGIAKSSGKSTANHKIDDKLETHVKDYIKFPVTKASVREVNTSNKRMKPTTKERVILENNVGFVKSSGKSTANHEINEKLGNPVKDHIKLPDAKASVPEINTSSKWFKPTTKERVILENNAGFVKSPGKSTAAGSKVTKETVLSLMNNVGFDESSGKSTATESKVTKETVTLENNKETVTLENNAGFDKSSGKSTASGSKATKERVALENNVGFNKSSGKSTAAGSKVTKKTATLENNVGFVKSSGKSTAAGSKVTIKKTATLENSVGSVNSSGKSTAAGSKATTERGALENSVDLVKSSGKSTAAGSKATTERGALENNVDLVKSSGKSTAAGSKATTERVALDNNVDLVKSSGKSTAAGSKGTGRLPLNKPKSNETSRRVSTENKNSVSNLIDQKLNASMSKGFKPSQHDNQVDDADNGTLSIQPLRTTLPPAPMSKGLKQSKQLDDADNQTSSIKPIRSVLSPLDADSEKGLVDSFKEARSSILLEGVVGKQKLGDVEDKLVLNHDLPESTDIQEEQACINESEKRSLRHGSLEEESDKKQEFKIIPTWKTSAKRTQVKKNDRRELGVSSQLFKEKGAVSKAKTKTRPVKEVSSHKRKTRSETKSFQTPDRVVPAGFAAGPNYEYSLHHSAGWLDE